MFIYNITYNIAEEIHEAWLQWMRSVHIPEFVLEGKFESAKLIKVLVEEDMGGMTYTVQYHGIEKQVFDTFLIHSYPILFSKMSKKFPNQFVSFSTELLLIDEFTNPNNL